MAFLSSSYLLSKVGDVNPSTRLKAVEIINAAHAAGHRVRFVWGKSNEGEHATGNALDIMVFDKAAGDFVRGYVWANRARLRLRHVIWWRSITSTVTSPGVRRGMADRGNTTENHNDHNHIYFLDSRTYVAPSGHTTVPPKKTTTSTSKAPAFPLPSGHYFGPKRGPAECVSGFYSHRADLKAWQSQMKARGWDIDADGLFGDGTARVTRKFQAQKRLTVSGLINAQTWAAAWTMPT